MIRNSRHTVIMLPGWATNGRIFELFPLSSKRGGQGVKVSCGVKVTGSSPVAIKKELSEYLSESSREPVILFGWSLGGFIAAELAHAFPRQVRSIILVGVRQRYPTIQLDNMKAELFSDKTTCLTSFYQQCFLPAQKEEYRDFRRHLMTAYLEELTVPDLCAGLDYLSQAELNVNSLPDCPITFIHGAQDRIAPVQEVEELAEQCENARLIVVPDAGHAVMLSEGFRDIGF